MGTYHVGNIYPDLSFTRTEIGADLALKNEWLFDPFRIGVKGYLENAIIDRRRPNRFGHLPDWVSHDWDELYCTHGYDHDNFFWVRFPDQKVEFMEFHPRSVGYEF